MGQATLAPLIRFCTIFLAIDEAQNESFTTQLITKIVDNLQVKIRNIHIRFEDKLSRVDGKQFSFGITLEQLSAISTNSNWDEAFITDPVDKIHKLLNLESLSVYWDSFSGHSLLGLEAEPFLDSFRRFIDNTPDKNDILMPITGCGKVIIHKKPKPHEPKTLINLFFDQLALQFDNEQYFDLLNLVNYFVAANRLNQVLNRLIKCKPI